MRKGEGPQQASSQSGTGPRHSGRIITHLNTSSKYSVLKVEEVQLSDSALYLCAVQDTLVQGAAGLCNNPGEGGDVSVQNFRLGKVSKSHPSAH